jgi:hypothetical protein
VPQDFHISDLDNTVNHQLSDYMSDKVHRVAIREENPSEHDEMNFNLTLSYVQTHTNLRNSVKEKVCLPTQQHQMKIIAPRIFPGYADRASFLDYALFLHGHFPQRTLFMSSHVTPAAPGKLKSEGFMNFRMTIALPTSMITSAVWTVSSTTIRLTWSSTYMGYPLSTMSDT